MPTRDEITQFSEDIEKNSIDKRIGFMDAIMEYCNNTGLEVEVAATLLTSSLKSKIKEEAQSLNLLKKTAKLPI
jgi:hypothetical protein